MQELKELLEAIYLKGHGYGFGFPAQLAGNLKDITEKQFAGFYGEAGNATRGSRSHRFPDWSAETRFAPSTCSRASSTSSSTRRSTLESTPQPVRVILGALLNRVYEARGHMGGRILFLLDEVARLGDMSILETARDAGRKYGVNLCLLYQSLGQMRGSFGEAG
jgi:type IV secretion system protein VirD4